MDKTKMENKKMEQDDVPKLFFFNARIAFYYAS